MAFYKHESERRLYHRQIPQPPDSTCRSKDIPVARVIHSPDMTLPNANRSTDRCSKAKIRAGVFQLLKENHIDYVAFDDGARHGELIKEPNEQGLYHVFSEGL